MRSLIRTLGIGVVATALIATAPAAQAGRGHDDDNDHHKSETSIDDIDRYGFIANGGDTAYLKVTYTCPEHADAAMKVSLEQERDKDNDNHRSHGGKRDTTTGSEVVYDLDCTGDSEREFVAIEADGDSEWESGDAEAEALIVSRTEKDDHGHEKSEYDSDFERADVKLVKKSHH